MQHFNYVLGFLRCLYYIIVVFLQIDEYALEEIIIILCENDATAQLFQFPNCIHIACSTVWRMVLIMSHLLSVLQSKTVNILTHTVYHFKFSNALHVPVPTIF